MTDNMFDKFVGDKLRNHQSAVPPGLWEKIERKKDDKPKGGFWWMSQMGLWAGLFVIVTSLTLGHYFFSNPTEDQQQKSSNTTKGAGSGNVASTTTQNSTLDEKPEATSQNIIGETNSTSSEDDISGAKDNTAHRSITDLSAIKDQSQNKSNIKTIAYRSDNKRIRFGRTSDRNVDVLVRKDGKGIGSTYASGTTGQVMDHATDASQSLLLSKGTTAYGMRNLYLASNNLDVHKINVFGIDCPPNGRQRRNDWYLELYGSPDKAFKTVSGSAAFVRKKDSTETTQLGYTAGFRISKSITDNILFKAGLQYTQINERFDLRTENERRITTVITIRTVSTAAGTDTMVRDTSTLTQIGYNVKRTYNRYRNIEVPLLLSYEFGNENLKFAVNGGVILNLRSFYSGETLNDSLAVVSLNSKSAPMYKQNIGLGIYAGFSVMKPLSVNTDIFLEPYFRYNLSNMTTSAGYSQKFSAAGVSFGIRYKLNRQRR